MRFDKRSPPKRPNRFESATALRTIYEKLEKILKLLVKLDHSNLLRVYDFWFAENDEHAKLVVITEYSAGGSLRRLLEAAMSKSGANRGRVKISNGHRWLNQTLYLLRSLHNDGISLFQGAFNADTIFIQSCGVIKLAPVLLALNGLGVFENGVFKCNPGAGLPRIELNEEFRVRILCQYVFIIDSIRILCFKDSRFTSVRTPRYPNIHNKREIV